MLADFQQKEGAKRRGYACRQIFNIKGVLIKGFMLVHCFSKIIQLSACSDHDRVVKFNRRGCY